MIRIRVCLQAYRKFIEDCHPEQKRGSLVFAARRSYRWRKQEPRSFASLGTTSMFWSQLDLLNCN